MIIVLSIMCALSLCGVMGARNRFRLASGKNNWTDDLKQSIEVIESVKTLWLTVGMTAGFICATIVVIIGKVIG